MLTPFQDPVDRDLRLLGEMRAVQRDDRQHRLIGTIGAGTNQPRTNHGRAVSVDLIDPEFRMLLGELGEARGLAVHKTEVVGSQATILAFVNQHEIGARGILGKASLQQLLPDHARRIRREEPKIIVLGDPVPRRGEIVQARGQDEPSQNDGPRVADHETGYEREHETSPTIPSWVCMNRTTFPALPWSIAYELSRRSKLGRNGRRQRPRESPRSRCGRPAMPHRDRSRYRPFRAAHPRRGSRRP